MSKNILVINVDIRETRVALIENGVIAELQIERHASRGTLGNIYLGKVSRVLPGMQAAFIDIGEERAAFLHVEDLIRPDDFEAYLAGGHKHEREGEDRPPSDTGAASPPALEAGQVPAAETPQAGEPTGDDEPLISAEGRVPSPEDDAESEDEGEDEGEDGSAFEVVEDALSGEGADEDDAEDEDETDAEDAETDAEDEDAEDGDAEDGEDGDEDEDEDETDAEDGDAEDGDDTVQIQVEVDPELGGVATEVVAVASAALTGGAGEPAVGEPGAEGDEGDPGQSARRSRRGGRRRRGRGGSTRDRVAQEAAAVVTPAPEAPKPERSRGREGGRRGRGGKGGGETRARDDKSRDAKGRESKSRDGRSRESKSRAKDPLRVSKSTPIREVVREGQEIIVQVGKEPIGTKGARVTSHLSLPGRYVVYLPTVEHVGISKRIGNDKERGRLREAIEAMKPPQGGLIVRTLAEGLTKKGLKQDVGYLVRLWGEIVKKREETRRAPECLYAELDLVLKTARDLFTDDIDQIVIDSREEYGRLKRFVEMFMPERADAIELYEGEEPIFDAYGIEDEIGRALARKVPLASGGHLVIDQAEALTAIDVNTGRFVGKGSKDLEETILQTNMEAVEEIAYQLRFRNLGGLIILDLIDMDRAGSREKVRRKLEQLLAKDKAKTTLNRISELGLIEMTRKRTRESLGRTINEPCFYCDGTGNLQSKQTVAFEILRQIKRDRQSLRGYTVIVNAHPAVIDLLKNEERSAVVEAERRYQRRLDLVPRKEYHLEQFDLIGR